MRSSLEKIVAPCREEENHKYVGQGNGLVLFVVEYTVVTTGPPVTGSPHGHHVKG